jgi:glycosyltransferase involved in cell wall biosynthesis
LLKLGYLGIYTEGFQGGHTLYSEKRCDDFRDETMKFSVVIPCYNAERWIVETLESVTSQTLLPHEILVVDDGSSDRSVVLVSALIETSCVPITLLRSKRQGPALARNVGISAATGDWVAFLDADDWWQPNHLARICEAVETSGDVVYLAAAEHFSINVNRVVSRSDSPFSTLQQQIDHATYFALYQKHGLLELSAAAVCRQRLEEVGGFKPEFRGAEDFELIMRAVHGRTLAYDPVPSSYYRCNNPDSHSRQLALDADCLTAFFRSLQSLQDGYSIPRSMLIERAKTIASKSMLLEDVRTRQRVLTLVWPYLTQLQQILFSTASWVPGLYLWLNDRRNTIRGPQYKPRQVM